MNRRKFFTGLLPALVALPAIAAGFGKRTMRTPILSSPICTCGWTMYAVRSDDDQKHDRWPVWCVNKNCGNFEIVFEAARLEMAATGERRAV